MEYNAKIESKLNNLIQIHNKHEEFFIKKMEYRKMRDKLTQEDTRLWFKRVKEKDAWKDLYSITISGSSLMQCGSGLFFWRKIEVMSKYEDPVVRLKSLLYDFGLKYFHDEDAQGGGLFIGKTSTGQDLAYCYVSPDFADGYWENHSLETKTNIPY